MLLCHVKLLLNKFACFSPVNLSYAPLILRSRRNPCGSGPSIESHLVSRGYRADPRVLEKPQVPTGDAASAADTCRPGVFGVPSAPRWLAIQSRKCRSARAARSTAPQSSCTREGKAKIWQLKSSEMWGGFTIWPSSPTPRLIPRKKPQFIKIHAPHCS